MNRITYEGHTVSLPASAAALEEWLQKLRGVTPNRWYSYLDDAAAALQAAGADIEWGVGPDRLCIAVYDQGDVLLVLSPNSYLWAYPFALAKMPPHLLAALLGCVPGVSVEGP